MPAADAKIVTEVSLEQSDSDQHLGEGVEMEEIRSVGELSQDVGELTKECERLSRCPESG